MGHRCCSKQKVKRGLWSPEEDERLVKYITTHGHGSWSSVPKLAGLQRCGKSCRLRWINYLRPDLKRGSFCAQEEQIIIDVHRILGNRWAQIAKHLPGRTDNEVKNFWNSCVKKKLIAQGLDPRTHNLIPAHQRSSSTSSTKYASYHNNTNTSDGMTSLASHSHQQPFSIITVKDSAVDTNPPRTTPISNSSSQFRNPNHTNLLWAPTLPPPPHHLHQVPSATTFSNWVHSSVSDSLVNVPSSGFGLLLDQGNCINWDSGFAPTLNRDDDENINNSNNNPYDGEEGQRDEYPKEMRTGDTQMVHNIEVGGVGNKGQCFLQEMGGAAANSFDSPSFDFEFVESTLLSSSAGSICRDLTSMDDDLAWNF